jgi:hypothetical protein
MGLRQVHDPALRLPRRLSELFGSHRCCGARRQIYPIFWETQIEARVRCVWTAEQEGLGDISLVRE